MPRKYVVELNIVTAAAEAAARKSVSTLEGVERAALKGAVSWEKAGERAAAAAVKLAERQIRENSRAVEAAIKSAEKLLASREKAEAKAAIAATRTAERQAREASKAADQAIRSAEKLLATREKAEAKAASVAAKASERQNRENNRAADAAIRDANRVLAAREKADRKAEASAAKAAERQAREASRAADAAIRSAEKLLAARERTEAKAAAEIDKAATRAVRAEEKKAQQLDAIQNRFLVKDSRRRVEFERRKEEAAKKAADKSSLLAEGISTVAGSFALLGGAGAILSAIATSFTLAAEKAYEAQKLVKEYRESLLELAALKGQIGDTSQTLKEDIALRSVTLQTAAEANKFQQTALGVGASSIDTATEQRFISRDEFTKAMTSVGAQQVATGLTPDVAGQLVGTIPMLLGRRTDAEETTREVERMRRTFDPGGASFGSLSAQYLSAATPLVTSGIMDKNEAAALTSAFSVASPGQAGERLQQFTRGTIGALGRGRKVTGMEGAYSESQGEYLRSIGATDQESAIQIANRISDDLEKQRATAAAAGKKFSPQTYLQERGYGDQEARLAVLEYAGMHKTGQFEKAFLAPAQRLPTLAEAQDPVTKFQRTDPVGIERKSKLTEEFAGIATGAGPKEYYESLLRATFSKEKLEGNKRLPKTYEETLAVSWNPLDPNFSGDARRGLEERALRDLATERQRVTGKAPPGQGLGGLLGDVPLFATTDFEERAKIAAGMAGEIGSAGGDVLPGSDKIRDAAGMMLDAASMMQKAMEQKPKPAGQKPPPAPLRGAQPPNKRP
jgi:hypothetical protein